ncbi:hypothetical protein CPB83DRAFT_883358 [Crepidotus variabilis]|uniref:Uncharacterized protein n=1 Tax=Crepidotus variabilis TaxID=179855 RepID=A0A9P6EGU5_9AGAR|nr:hypothetical protein CPB83DRAFT_883358 [Crepidotus variabilis]
MIKTRQRKLGHLEISCNRAPDFDQAFGQRTRHAILDLIPHSSPAYVNLLITKSSSNRGHTQLTTLLSGSTCTLRVLEILLIDSQLGYEVNPDTIRFDFSKFSKLSTIRVKYDALVFGSACGFFAQVQWHLAFAVTFLASAPSLSCLAESLFEIRLIGLVQHFDGCEEMISSVQPVNELNRKGLLARHPNLKSFDITVVLQFLKGYLPGNDALALQNVIRRCIKKSLPNSAHLPDFQSSERAAVFKISLDHL